MADVPQCLLHGDLLTPDPNRARCVRDLEIDHGIGITEYQVSALTSTDLSAVIHAYGRGRVTRGRDERLARTQTSTHEKAELVDWRGMVREFT